jgi:hypothetical protein
MKIQPNPAERCLVSGWLILRAAQAIFCSVRRAVLQPKWLAWRAQAIYRTKRYVAVPYEK